MSLILKPVAIHGIVGNAPYIISVAATAAPTPGRVFTGTGAPGNSTLNNGNGMFNGLNSGFVINASLAAAGTGYAVNDVVSLNGGTASRLPNITVDMVSSGGAIVDFHVSQAGNYSAYPGAGALTVTNVSGSLTGSGAQFLLNVPAPDYYLDTTTLSAPILYVCTTSGNASTSAWAKVSGGGGASGVQQFKLVSDGGDYWVCHTWDGTTPGTVNLNVIKPYKLRAGPNAIGSEVIRSVTYTYSYTGVYLSGSSGPYAYYTRAVSGSDGSSETDYLTPDPIAGDVLYATPVTTTICSGIPTTVQSGAVNSGGSGYVSEDVGKVLTVAGGTGTSATLTIASVSGGEVTGVTVTTGGNYTANPTLTANVATGSTTGSGATFNLTLAGQLLDLNTDARAWSN
jgi:hypothetical protein